MRESFDERVRGSYGTLVETLRALAALCSSSPDRAALERAAARRLALTRRLLAADDETLAVLDVLRAAGLRLGVVSDCSIETPTLWATSPLAARIDATAFSCLLGMCKPQAGMYEHVTSRLGVEPRECVYVGDGESHELRGAASLGMLAVRIVSLEVAHGRDGVAESAAAKILRLGDLLLLPEVAAGLHRYRVTIE